MHIFALRWKIAEILARRFIKFTDDDLLEEVDLSSEPIVTDGDSEEVTHDGSARSLPDEPPLSGKRTKKPRRLHRKDKERIIDIQTRYTKMQEALEEIDTIEDIIRYRNKREIDGIKINDAQHQGLIWRVICYYSCKILRPLLKIVGGIIAASVILFEIYAVIIGNIVGANNILKLFKGKDDTKPKSQTEQREEETTTTDLEDVDVLATDILTDTFINAALDVEGLNDSDLRIFVDCLNNQGDLDSSSEVTFNHVIHAISEHNRNLNYDLSKYVSYAFATNNEEDNKIISKFEEFRNNIITSTDREVAASNFALYMEENVVPTCSKNVLPVLAMIAEDAALVPGISEQTSSTILTYATMYNDMTLSINDDGCNFGDSTLNQLNSTLPYSFNSDTNKGTSLSVTPVTVNYTRVRRK